MHEVVGSSNSLIMFLVFSDLSPCSDFIDNNSSLYYRRLLYLLYLPPSWRRGSVSITDDVNHGRLF